MNLALKLKNRLANQTSPSYFTDAYISCAHGYYGDPINPITQQATLYHEPMQFMDYEAYMNYYTGIQNSYPPGDSRVIAVAGCNAPLPQAPPPPAQNIQTQTVIQTPTSTQETGIGNTSPDYTGLLEGLFAGLTAGTAAPATTSVSVAAPGAVAAPSENLGDLFVQYKTPIIWAAVIVAGILIYQNMPEK